MLPRLRYRDGAALWACERFTGLDRTPGAGPGALRDGWGLSFDGFPALRSADAGKRKTDASRRCRVGAYQYGRGADEWIFFDVDDGEDLLTVTYGGMADGAFLGVEGAHAPFARPVCVPFQDRLLVFPYKLALRTDVLGFTDDRGAIENPRDGDVWADAGGFTCYVYRGGSWAEDGPVVARMESRAVRSVRFRDGTYAGETAEANTIWSSGADWTYWFSVGDAVTISGASDPENNKTLIIREIDGACLRFYEHSFTVTETAETVTISRTVPDVDFACANENRVWGCAGQHLYASKLGDWRNWNVFDGLESDSFAVDVLAGGDFTACVSFLGYPVLFKRGAVYKVYGNRPGNFEVLGSACTGAVSNETLAVAGETLFYLSERGIMRYSGGIPVPVSGPLADFITGAEDAFGASDGRRYFFGYKDKVLYVRDTETGAWGKEVFPSKLAGACGGLAGAVFLTADGHRCGELDSGTALPDAFRAELSEADLGAFAAKYPAQLWLRMENSAAVTVAVRYDGGDWETVCTVSAGAMRVLTVGAPLRRCDRFALRFSGSGAWTLRAVGIAARRERNDRKGG